MTLAQVEISGHADTRRDLHFALAQGRFAHAHLFVGARGVGKSLVAREVAEALLCHQRSEEGKACGECASCRLNAHQTHQDLHWFAPDKNNYSVEYMRNEVLDWAARKPREGSVKVGILDGCERLGSAAANAFLKTLEEPPAGTHWILLSEDLGRVMTTIISRTRVVHFAALDSLQMDALVKGKLEEDLQTILRERSSEASDDEDEAGGISPAEHAFALAMAQGAPGRYLESVRELVMAQRDRLVERMIGRDKQGLILAAEKLLEACKRSSDENQDPLRRRLTTTLDLMLSLLRDMQLLDQGLKARLVHADATSRLQRAQKRFDPLLAEVAVDRLSELAALVGRNVAPRLILINALFAFEDAFSRDLA